MTSAQTHTATLRRVASTAVDDAREAWKRARAHPDERRTRAAYRACVFAARALRQAVGELPHHTGRKVDRPSDAPQMLEEADKLDTAAAKLRAQLARLAAE